MLTCGDRTTQKNMVLTEILHLSFHSQKLVALAREVRGGDRACHLALGLFEVGC